MGGDEMGRRKILSVTLADCRVDTFRAGGKGGQNQNTRDTGVRITHPPSGAVGESREERSQLQNKKRAWRRMIESAKFKVWLGHVLLQSTDLDKAVEEEMRPENLKVEVMENRKWVPYQTRRERQARGDPGSGRMTEIGYVDT